MISKIIHQIAPKNKKLWHPVWKKCRESWEKNFSEFDFFLWSDDEDLSNFIKSNYPQYYDFYLSIDHHTMQIDIARYLIMHKYGGIYADMDMYCFKNFYNDLDINSLCLLDGNKEGDIVENALIASPPNCDFFIRCVDLSQKRFNKVQENKKKYKDNYECNEYTLEVCGPPIVSDVYYDYYEDKIIYEGNVFIMKKSLYNVPWYSYSENYKTKHMLTGVWGKETINGVLNNTKNKKIDELEDKFIDCYWHHRHINLLEFDFHKNYDIRELDEIYNNEEETK